MTNLTTEELLEAMRARKVERKAKIADVIAQREKKNAIEENPVMTYTITIQTDPKHIRDYSDRWIGGFGWSASVENCLPSLQKQLRFTVLVMKGKVFLSNEIMSAFGRASHLPHAIKFGRRGFFALDNEQVFEHILDSISYERRSKTEKLVQKRNESLAEWLDNLQVK